MAVGFHGHPMFPATGFNGDGHVSRSKIKDGSVNYRGRHVKTARLHAERAVHKRLFGIYGNYYTEDPSVWNINRSAANTRMRRQLRC